MSAKPGLHAQPCTAQRWKGRRTFFLLLCLVSLLGAAPSVLVVPAVAPWGAVGAGGGGKPPGTCPEVPWNTRVKKSCRSAAELGLPLEVLLLVGSRAGWESGGPNAAPVPAHRAPRFAQPPGFPVPLPALTSAARPRQNSAPRRRCGRGHGGCQGRSPRADSQPTLWGDMRRHGGLALTLLMPRDAMRPPVMS